MHGQAAYPNVYLYRRVVNAKLFIDSHFHEAINLDNIADEAAFSKFHFIRLFKSAYNYTPHQYLIRVRVEKAALMLQKGMSVGDTCYGVGFDSISSFSLLFKKIYKVSPANYRQRELNRRAEMTIIPRKFIPNCFAEQNGWV